MLASNVIATDCFGGPGLNTNYGFYTQFCLIGGGVADRISITAGSLGTGSNNYGVYSFNGTFSTGDGGTISLTGSGGGSYNGSGNSNYRDLYHFD